MTDSLAPATQGDGMPKLSKEAVDVLMLARTLIDRRWSNDRFGEWDRRTGRRTVFCITGALIVATDTLSLRDTVRYETMEPLEVLTVERRTVPKQGGGTEVKDLAWWSDQVGREEVLKHIDTVLQGQD